MFFVTLKARKPHQYVDGVKNVGQLIKQEMLVTTSFVYSGTFQHFSKDKFIQFRGKSVKYYDYMIIVLLATLYLC